MEFQTTNAIKGMHNGVKNCGVHKLGTGNSLKDAVARFDEYDRDKHASNITEQQRRLLKPDPKVTDISFIFIFKLLL